jgi:hypothetical protein
MKFTARYPGQCARTGAPIKPGDRIESVGRGRYALADDSGFALAIDPDAFTDPEAAQAAGRYLRQSLERSVSNFYRTSSGAEMYRNRRGRCEDAPCCGCCNY